jgi:transcriptional regulator with XRE-family HTH domain
VTAAVTLLNMTHPLATYREKHAMTRAALARHLSVSKTTIARWEEGSRKIRDDKVSFVAEQTGIPAKKLRPDLAELLGSAQ